MTLVPDRPDLADLNALRRMIAPKAVDAELAVFALVAAKLDLDPFGGQIVLIGRWDSQAERTVFKPQITVAGRRAIAQRTGRLRGIDGPFWSGPRDPDGALDWHDVWTEDETPYAARCLVYVDGWQVPANGTAKWSEFSQTDGKGKLTPTWSRMPSHMLGKVAESMALRRAFPEVDAAVAMTVPQMAIDPDDAATVAEAEAEPAAAQVSATVADDAQTRLIGTLLDQLAVTIDDLDGVSLRVGVHEIADLNETERRAVLNRLKALGRERAAQA